MTLSDAQVDTLNGLDHFGINGLDTGTPCECGSDADTTTTSTRGYSDQMKYKHRCKDCGQKWTSWTSG